MDPQQEVNDILSNVRSIKDLTRDKVLALRGTLAGRIRVENLQASPEAVYQSWGGGTWLGNGE